MGLQVLLAYPHNTMWKRIYNQLLQDEAVEHIDVATTSEELQQHLAHTKLDFIVVHHTLVPDMALLPKGHFLLVISTMADRDLVLRAQDYGACGCLLENFLSVFPSIAHLLATNAPYYTDPAITSWLFSHLDKNIPLVDPAERLTKREHEVLDLARQGLNDKEIATKLCISRETVKKHKSHIHSKLGIHHISVEE